MGRLLACWFLLAVAYIGAADAMVSSPSILDMKIFKNNIKRHLEELSVPRFPAKDNATIKAWLSTRAYVENQFKMSGLDTELQCFNTTVFTDNENIPVKGCNVIAVTKGDSHKHKIVVGAHYDSSQRVSDSAPIRDNGMGLAVLMEVALAFEESVRWQGFHKNFTTVFVAFDINSMEHERPSIGTTTGSHAFVTEWLKPELGKMPLGGAFILDSVASYYDEDNTQQLPSDFQKYFPDAYWRIYNDTSKGNFIAAVGNSLADKVVDQLSGNYYVDKMARPYRLQPMVTGPDGFGFQRTWEMFRNTDARAFWLANPKLPAVLLTDTTGDSRPIPDEEKCAANCTVVFTDDRRLEFVRHTYAALTRTLLDMQTTFVPSTGGANEEKVASVVTLLFCACLTRLLLL